MKKIALIIVAFSLLSCPLLLAADQDDQNLVKNLSKYNMRYTLGYYMAAFIKDKDFLRIILEEKPRALFQKDEYGFTLLHHLVFEAHLLTNEDIDEINELLRECLTSVDNNGNTALHIAAALFLSSPTNRETRPNEHIFFQLIALAIEAKFNFALKNKDGKTAWDLANAAYSLRTNNDLSATKVEVLTKLYEITSLHLQTKNVATNPSKEEKKKRRFYQP